MRMKVGVLALTACGQIVLMFRGNTYAIQPSVLGMFFMLNRSPLQPNML